MEHLERRKASHFVGLSRDRTHFQLQGAPFFIAGANCYYFLASALDIREQGIAAVL